ncbi:hypothetical protein ACEUZ9_004681 [Paracoccus litorisediminis]|uniref:hypothetical protein n=1 Tax=Paracoccus litorisediminis TaxID=2006130 RepID=UPI003731D591
MATRIVEKMKKARERAPGAQVIKAKKMSKYMLLALLLASLVTAGLMYLGYGAPGAAWIYDPKG